MQLTQINSINKRHVIFLVILLAAAATEAFAVFPAEVYMKQIRAQMSNCAMQYRAQYYYPDSSSLSASGSIGWSGRNYYDSSNVRFVLANEEWLVAADHRTRLLSVAYLPALQEQYRGWELNTSSFLFSDKGFMENLILKKERETADTLWVTMSFRNRNDDKIILQLLKKDFSLTGYQLVMSVPLNGFLQETEGGEMMRVEMQCSHIVSPAPATLFSHHRLINVQGQSAKLKRFNEYTIYQSTSKKI